ncbi:MAG: Ig-like domain-containing protein [Akkermansiaceae bacterium]|nr:Ig-like domain-containing protein [Akkermansiaceae bacterium]
MTISNLVPLAVAVGRRVFSTRWISACAIPVVLQGVAPAAVVNANFTSATTIPVTAASYTATGNTVNLSLGFAPPTGTSLTVVKNTGLAFIQGTFDNLAQGQRVELTHGGIVYPFIADYFAGTGNDLVLRWGNTRLVAWGRNDLGQLAQGDRVQREVPTPITDDGVLAGKTILSVAVGWDHCVALCSDGTLAAWGKNFHGQIGNPIPLDRDVPVLVMREEFSADKRVIAVAAGASFSLALCDDGTILSWGSNFYGELADRGYTGGYGGVARPVNTTSGALVGKIPVAIRASSWNALVLCSDGSLVSWGRGEMGGLGNGTLFDSAIPVAVVKGALLEGKGITGIATGAYHSMVLCSDGTMGLWGWNPFGELGIASRTMKSLPVAPVTSGVLNSKTVVAIAGNGGGTLALCSDGSLSSWGNNQKGELGNGTDGPYSTVPVMVDQTGVLAGKTITQAGGGMALCSDGTLASWGDNTYGQLGIGSTVHSKVPVLVNTRALNRAERVIAVASGVTSRLALVASPPPPIATTLAADSIHRTGATLHASVNANGRSTAVTFEYGPSPSYGTTVSASPATLTGATPTAVSAVVSGLPSATPFHYRVIASSSGGVVRGPDQTFTTLPNTPPVFSGYAVGTPYQAPASIALRKLLGRASDPDGDAVSVTATGPASAHGGTVALLADAIRYAPPNGFSGADTFSVTVTDAAGASVTGTVTVQVGAGPSAGGAGNNPPMLSVLPDGGMGISFQGIAGRTYTVQRSVGGLDDWATLAIITADAAGKVSFTDDNPPPGSAFYRLGVP